MAAVKRIKYLLTGGEYQATPNTITYINGAVRSYGMNLIVGEGGARFVTNERSTPTTNRHIQAAHQAMAELGYVEDGKIEDAGCYHDPTDVCDWTRYVMKTGAE